MSTPRSIDDFGGIFVDAVPVQAPTMEQSADYANRLHEDVAQMTRTAIKCAFTFPTSTGGAATISASSVLVRSQFGTGASAKPVVAKTATGLYTATFATSYVDGLSETESLVLYAVWGAVQNLTAFGHVQAIVASHIVSIAITDLAAAASDLTNGTSILIVAI